MADAGARGFVAGRSTAFWLVLLAAGGTFAVTMGARQSMGLFLNTLNTSTGLGLASISLAFAFGQLWWGLTQPFAGMVADRYGAGRVIVAGVLLVALGTALVPFMTTTAGLILAIGVLAAGGAGMAGVSVLMAATTRLVSPERRGMATGLVNAGGSFGQFVFAPIAQGLTAVAGWVVAMQSLAVLSLLALPAAWVLRGHSRRRLRPGTKKPETTREAIRRALHDPSYRLLGAGFFVCGFHVAFIATHLPGVVAACQLPPSVAPGRWRSSACSTSSAASRSAGRSGRWRMKSLLSLIYATRGWPCCCSCSRRRPSSSCSSSRP
jgi:MFS family permease